MHKFKDPLIIWATSGIFGVIIRDTDSFFAKQIGLAKFYIWDIGAALLIEKAEVKTIFGTIAGLLVDIVIGSILGVSIGLFLKWRGKSYYIIKGLGIGLMAWLFMYGLLFHNLPFTKTSAPSDPLSNISAFIGHAIFGMVTAFIYVKGLSKYEA